MKYITKKLSMTVLIISTLMLSGCGSNNTEKTAEERKEDVEKNGDSQDVYVTENEEFEVIQLSADKTEGLTEGYEINCKGINKIEIPNEDALEKKGLMYEFTYHDYEAINDGEMMDLGYSYFAPIPMYIGEATFVDDDGVKRHQKAELVKVRIVPIVRIKESDGKYIKYSVDANGETTVSKLFNADNVSLLEDKLDAKME